MKKIIIFVILVAILGIGIRVCHQQDYVNTLKYSADSAQIFISSDSITIAPHLYVEDFNTLGAVVNFASLKDSLLLEDLRVTVHSKDNPGQSIQLTSVSAVIHPVVPNGGNLDKKTVNRFEDLSLHDKTITYGGLPYNSIIFYFRTWQIRKTDFYNFKITGRLVYKGQTFNFEKEIETHRIVEYHPYRMMT